MPTPGIQQIQTFHTQFSQKLNPDYLLYLPKDYEEQPEKRWPFILFLHGGGECGTNIDRVKSQGLPKLLKEDHEFPFVVISPQCSPDEWWHTDRLHTVLDETVNEYRVDPDRIYVTGLSMGGFGTWALATAYPNRFAAIAPICGGGNPTTICAIQHLPVWTFHGAKDSIVPVHRTEILVDALKACGGNVRFTSYPDAEHDSWTQTYDNPQLYDWFLENRRGNGTA